ncbi:alanine--tRNA ligase [Candidatus Uhrbacteria bacterium CG10_big_fil_rev_8_21_14_0_10_50_16]|uniref:Alanine--tRNA ligase n=1 Tax=Candidatus Uhrbacteria bacterium CG10_big_fil_rev_8_21_14_0_10_50_16 TaxID=1975039 RepID=A0A2H0RN77_9BACT|nr:MAG: alanine--tRNA ligase [Candidatus Uhrbacteria bacterium CG10_big_fil_rev_8_21_14_0_10_50_16]
MTAHQLRRAYIDFFVSKGHVEIPSASLVPENDPSVLFTTAGMHPLVPYLKGETHPAGTRLVDVQKCVRTGDIDEVGDNTHLTFFEMLGNWSLGDYFKQESIAWSFELLKDVLHVDMDRIAVSVFAGDDDCDNDLKSFNKWLELGIPEGRIAKLGKEDNWWPAGGKHSGPQGPDTEIFYWTGTDAVPDTFDPENNLWVEIWNNVFMQFDRSPEGVYTPLAKQNVDTGMGLERTLAVLTGKSNVFETDLFVPIIEAIESVSHASYTDNERAMRIIADHVRTSVMMVADGVFPSNKDQGYILRRLIRRAIRQISQLNEVAALESIARVAINTLEPAYPDLTDKTEAIINAINAEEAKFTKTLAKGLREFEKIFDARKNVSGEEAFILYSTYGFPIELTEELVREKGQQVDRETFQAEFTNHQNLSRAGAEQKFAGGLADHSDETTKLHTATHLLHKALRMVLGDHVEQKGSNITSERLRFDFSHPDKLTDAQKAEVESIVNEQIQANLPMGFEMMTVEEAKNAGAIGLFEDKYALLGDKIKVYTAGDAEQGVFSREICGGPHVEHTGDLGAFAILKEESSSSGIRRIKAVIGKTAVKAREGKKTQ